jgi:hypothetical protein
MVLACRRCCRLRHTILLDDAPHLFTCLSYLLLIAETTSITSVTYTFLSMTEEAQKGLDPTKGTICYMLMAHVARLEQVLDCD